MLRRRRKLNARGYLGPIGDDIPSLIPIIVGLITFFAAFTFTLNEFNQRSNSFSADRDTLVIANSLKGDSYLSTFSEFDIACKGLRVRGLNYAAAIVEAQAWNQVLLDAQNNPDAPLLSFVADHPFVLQGNRMECAAGLELPLNSSELATVLQDRPFVVLQFPVALEISTAVVPGTLVVITWKA